MIINCNYAMCNYQQGESPVRRTRMPTQTLQRLALLLFLFTAGFGFKAGAQDFFPEQKDYAVSISAGFELPGKNLEGYNGGAAYQIGFTRLVNDRFSVGVNMSYREFNPKVASVTYDIDAAHQQTLTYSTYSTFLFYLDAAYVVPLTEKVNFYGGLNLGLGYNTSAILFHDDSGDKYLSNGGKQLYAAPKAGFLYAINNNMAIDIHAAYNAFKQLGGSASSTSSSIMTVVGLMFKF